MGARGLRAKLVAQASTLQEEINAIMVEYAAVSRRNTEQAERFSRALDLLRELRKIRALLAECGATTPRLLNDDAVHLERSAEENGLVGNESAPPPDLSIN